jgi:hypothetical protein
MSTESYNPKKPSLPFTVECPHCHCMVVIEQINCAIFRHGVFKHNFQPIPPHASKTECDQWVKNNEIFGCGKPFQLNSQFQPIVCDYI